MSSKQTNQKTTTTEPSEGATNPEIVPETLPEEENTPLEPKSSEEESSEEDNSDNDDDDDEDDVELSSADAVEVIDIATVTNTGIPPPANTQQLNAAIRPYIIGETYKRKY